MGALPGLSVSAGDLERFAYVVLRSRSSLNLSDANLTTVPNDGSHADRGRATPILTSSNFSPSKPEATDKGQRR